MGGRSIARPWLALLLAAGLLGGSHLTALPAAAAGSSGACPTMSGVTVVVDFGALGGVTTRCAPVTPSSGLDALARAGFSVTLVTAGPFVCRIDGLGNASCADYPAGSDPSWAYWHAARGGSWSYSASGASSSHPAQGSVEGWVFEAPGSTSPPGVPPPAVPQATPKPTPRPTPKPTLPPTPQPTSVPVTAPARTARPSPGGATAAPAASPSAIPSGASATVAPSASNPAAATGDVASGAPSDAPSGDVAMVDPVSPPADAGTAPGAPVEDGAAAPADPGAPPVGTILGIALVGALFGGGYLLSRGPRAPSA